MDYLIVIIIALSLSLDAVAVTVCDGLSMELNTKRKFFIAATFAVMQGVMPLIGYFIGEAFLKYIHPYDVWLSFAILLIVGGQMVVEGARSLKNGTNEMKKFSVKTVLLQGVATSIDALAVGITLSTLAVPVWLDAILICAVTFGLCIGAVYLSQKIATLSKKTGVAVIIGGVVLIAIALKIVLEFYL